jgi:hypothetical protein
MRFKLGVLAAVVASTTLFIGMTTASGQSVVHLVLPGGALVTKVVDLGRDGLRLGDRLAFRGPLLNGSKSERVGTAYGECLVHRRIVNPGTGLYNCTYVLELAEGDIMVKGLDPRGPSVAEFAVFGGTGAYAGASGEATFTDTDSDIEGETDMVLRLEG